jgi:hypothetical protein
MYNELIEYIKLQLIALGTDLENSEDYGDEMYLEGCIDFATKFLEHVEKLNAN